jgi:hypothetical protein
MLDSRHGIAKLPLRKERNAKSGAAGNRKIARTKSRMARVFRSQKGQARLQQESRPFPRHPEEGDVVARRLARFYRGRGVGIIESCIDTCSQRKQRSRNVPRSTGDGLEGLAIP